MEQLARLETLVNDVTKEVKEVRKDVTEIKVRQETFLTRDSAEQRFYPRGELDALMSAIKENTSIFKDLFSAHVVEDRAVFKEMHSKLDTITEKVVSGNEKNHDRRYTWLWASLLFFLGIGANWLGQLIFK